MEIVAKIWLKKNKGKAVLLLLCLWLFVACGNSLQRASERAVKRAPTQRLSPAEQQRFSAVYLEAVCRRLREDYAGAYLLMEEALHLHPHAPEALYEMSLLTRESAVSWEDTAVVARADSLLERAAVLMPSNTTLLLALSERYTEKERFRDAIYYREKAAQQQPNDETHLYALTHLYRLAQEYAGAIGALNRLERLLGTTEEIALQKFELYATMADSARAFQALEDLCAQYPQELRYRVLLGDAYARVGRREMAQYIYEDVLTTEPNNGYAQLSLLEQHRQAKDEKAYYNMLERLVLNPAANDDTRLSALQNYAAEHLTGDSTAVLALFQKVLAMPQSNRHFAALCLSYMVQRELPISALRPVAKQLLSIEPDHKASRLALLQYAVAENEVAEVHQLCEEGLRYHPSEPAYYFYKALAYSEEKRYPEALSILERGTKSISLKADPIQTGELFSVKADLFHQLGRKEEAYAAYDSVVLYDSNNLLARNNYAYFLALDGKRLDYAEKLSRRTIEAEPQNATYLDTYAWILFQRKAYEQARVYIDSTLQYDTTPTATLYEHAGDIYFRTGAIQEAVAFWRKALKKQPTKADRRRILRKIQRRRI